MDCNAHIIKIAHHIRNSSVENKEKYFEEKYKIFKTKYPQLYSKLCNDDEFDMANLAFMLNVMSNKSNDKYGADVIVGQMLFDKYVKPQQDEDIK